MRTSIQNTLIALVSTGACCFGAAIAGAEATLDFANPAVALSGEAVIASGTCLAKYAAALDDPSKPAAAIAERIARRCARQISRSAGLASWMTGKPEDYAKNLKYVQEDLATNTVVRSRAAHPHST